MIKAYVTLVYGILIALGGIMGFVMAKSLPSLIAGGGLGIGLIVAAVLMMKSIPAGFPLAVACTALIGLNFIYLLIKALGADASLGRPIGILVLTAVELAVLFLVKDK